MSNVTAAELCAVSTLSRDVQRALRIAEASDVATTSVEITKADRAEQQHQARRAHFEHLERAYYQQTPLIQTTIDFASLNLAAAHQQHRLSSSDMLSCITASNRAAFTDANGNLNLATHSYPSTPPRLHSSKPSTSGNYSFPRTLTQAEVLAQISSRRARNPTRDPRRHFVPAVESFPLYNGGTFKQHQQRPSSQKLIHQPSPVPSTNKSTELTSWEQTLLTSTAAHHAALLTAPNPTPSTLAAATALAKVRAKATAHLSARRANGTPPGPTPCFFCFHECRFWVRRGARTVQVPCPYATDDAHHAARLRGGCYKGARPYKYYCFGIMPLNGKTGNYHGRDGAGDARGCRRGRGIVDAEGDSIMGGM